MTGRFSCYTSSGKQEERCFPTPGTTRRDGRWRPRQATMTTDAETAPWLKSYPEGVDWNAELPVHPLPRLLDEAVRNYRDRTCTDFLGRTLSYGQINDLTNRAARGLQALGVGKGSHVGLLLPNSPTYVIMFYAILRAGGTVVNCNPLYTVEELEFQVRDSGLDVMVTLDLAMLFGKVEALLEKGCLKAVIIDNFAALLPGVKSVLFRLFKRGQIAWPRRSAQAGKLTFFEDLVANDGRFEPFEVDPHEDVAVLQYTGGTTGTPKGAMLTHANLSVNTWQVRFWAPNLHDGQERAIGFLPLFHVFAMTTVMNFGLAIGAELVLVPRFDLDEALKLIHARHPTIMPGVPTIYNAMLNHPEIRSFDLSSLKFCVSGGAPLPVEVKRGFEAVSGCTLVEGYGLSETSPLATCNPVTGLKKEGSIGIPVSGTVIAIRSLDDPEKDVAPGGKGEICIRGPQVMKGYWRRPEETATAFTADGFFRSGDVGYMDEDGYIFIVDRLKDMIICSGFNVYPRTIEEAIYKHPAVEEVTVVGIPDDYRGEAPKAFVKLRPDMGLTADELLDFLRGKLSRIEMPDQIEFRDELPKTMIGKLSKKELREEG